MRRKSREQNGSPVFPQGTNTEFFGWFVGRLKEDTRGKNIDELWGMHLLFFPLIFKLITR